MDFLPSNIPDVILIKPRIFGDERGFFMETYRASLFAEAGIHTKFVQDNHSGSGRGTLRGIHYQIKQAQGKLVRIIAGEVFDVAVDLRRSSPTFGKWVGQLLTAENKMEMWIPPGFGHGFYVLSDWAEMVYKASDYYAPEYDRTLLWNDPILGIDWPLIDDKAPVLSLKDAEGSPLSFAEVYDW